ncbi:hypothetical protein GGTG_03373 [Gaeumannomyces tritici R3-111a-1]|uniref:Uncharacterized protein n=1 Tax=Gaeumannomyces tritici (strain R3-111a-1) TaxID=644352 RepID=J3NQ15_GAET3|nr:hypothetical protein GGTG_03373 [Gaeumannomyces tritici R3-111a-1]EJT78271.1 hypothetical protein GGTG_03373 [Gaeumannomyces tritici R3-111a-1]
MSAGRNSMDGRGVAVPADMTTFSPTSLSSAPSPRAATPPSPREDSRPAIKKEREPGSCRSSRSPSPSSNSNHSNQNKQSPTHASYSSTALNPFNLLLQSITHTKPSINDTMSSQGGSGSGSGSGSGGSQWNPILSHGSAIGIVKPNVVFDVYGNPQGSSGGSGRGSSSSGSNRGSSGGGSRR